MKAIDAAVDEIEAEQQDISAETSAEPDPDRPMPCPIEQKRPDGFLSGEGGTVSGGDRCTVHVHTDLDTLRADGEGAESSLENGGSVSAKTCIPDWDGEVMDDDLVVEALFQYEA